jgi:cholera toxin transcriptional activator
MPHASPSARIVRFGVFELDRAAGELRKSGAKIRLQEQPFQVLALLLDRPGDVVTRDELREKLWPADTFVDFDHSLNTAINKVREALGDSASSPRYVETLARRGYRFLAVVEPVQGSSPTSPPAAHLPAVSVSSQAESALHPELDVPLPHRAVTRGLFGLIQIMYLVFYLEALLHWPHVEPVASLFLPGWGSFVVAITVLITALPGIPLRCYLLSATAFDYGGLGQSFQRIFMFVLVLDLLWALAPFLLAPKIGFAPAFAATAALLYLPFSERTLIRMAYLGLRKSPASVGPLSR